MQVEKRAGSDAEPNQQNSKYLQSHAGGWSGKHEGKADGLFECNSSIRLTPIGQILLELKLSSMLTNQPLAALVFLQGPDVLRSKFSPSVKQGEIKITQRAGEEIHKHDLVSTCH